MKNRQTKQETHQQKLEKSLEIIYGKSEKIEFQVTTKGIVTLLIRQEHPIQRFFRRLKVDIPQYKSIKMDALGSFVFRHIDGNTSVEALGDAIEAEFREAAQPIYPRLLTFLNCMEKQGHYIQRVPQ